MRCISRLLHTLASAVSLLVYTQARAELVRAHVEGVVASSDIAALNGQSWTMSLVFDTSAPEVSFTATSSNFAEFFNTGAVKVIRLLDFSVGDSGEFTIHLVDPMPGNEEEVRIDIDNFTSKTFFAHVNDAVVAVSAEMLLVTTGSA